MTLCRKPKTIILIILGNILAFSPIIATNLIYISENKNIILDYSNDETTFIKDNLKISDVSGKVHVDNNWTAAVTAGICTGLGTFSEPYIIEDLVIDGYGSGCCILIEHSNSYFKIENCTLSNSYYGIRLEYTQNAQILNNNCSSHLFGISLSYSSNNSISGNIAFENKFNGIALFYSDKNNLSENFEQDNSDYGISLFDSDNNVILNNIINNGIELSGTYNNVSGNLMYECGLEISLSNTDNFYFQYIDTSNLVNGKPLYYYTNKEYLSPNNFTNAGQIIMASCGNSLVTNLNLSYSDTGLTMLNCYDNIIDRNSINNNRGNGIYIFGGDNITISNNTICYNMKDGFLLEYNSNNRFLENNVSYNNYNGFYCNRLQNSIISGNNINNNKKNGIRFFYCTNNTIIGNSLIGNEECFYVDSLSEENIFQNNDCINRAPMILGYDVFLLLGILSICTIIFSKKIRKQE